MRSLQLSLEECLASESDLADSVDLQTFSFLQVLLTLRMEDTNWCLLWDSNSGLSFWSSFETHWTRLLGPDLGSISGSVFWIPFLVPNFGTQLWIHFWDPIFCQFLGPVFDQKYEFWGPVFGTKFGSVFGVQNLDSLIFLIGDHFLVPIFGVQIWTQIWPPKLTKMWKKFPDRVPRRGARSGTPKCSENCQIWHTKITRSSQTGSTSGFQTEPNMTSNLVP